MPRGNVLAAAVGARASVGVAARVIVDVGARGVVVIGVVIGVGVGVASGCTLLGAPVPCETSHGDDDCPTDQRCVDGACTADVCGVPLSATPATETCTAPKPDDPWALLQNEENVREPGVQTLTARLPGSTSIVVARKDRIRIISEADPTGAEQTVQCQTEGGVTFAKSMDALDDRIVVGLQAGACTWVIGEGTCACRQEQGLANADDSAVQWVSRERYVVTLHNRPNAPAPAVNVVLEERELDTTTEDSESVSAAVPGQVGWMTRLAPAVDGGWAVAVALDTDELYVVHKDGGGGIQVDLHGDTSRIAVEQAPLDAPACAASHTIGFTSVDFASRSAKLSKGFIDVAGPRTLDKTAIDVTLPHLEETDPVSLQQDVFGGGSFVGADGRVVLAGACGLVVSGARGDVDLTPQPSSIETFNLMTSLVAGTANDVWAGGTGTVLHWPSAELDKIDEDAPATPQVVTIVFGVPVIVPLDGELAVVTDQNSDAAPIVVNFAAEPVVHATDTALPPALAMGAFVDDGTGDVHVAIVAPDSGDLTDPNVTFNTERINPDTGFLAGDGPLEATTLLPVAGNVVAAAFDRVETSAGVRFWLLVQTAAATAPPNPTAEYALVRCDVLDTTATCARADIGASTFLLSQADLIDVRLFASLGVDATRVLFATAGNVVTATFAPDTRNSFLVNAGTQPVVVDTSGANASALAGGMSPPVAGADGCVYVGSFTEEALVTIDVDAVDDVAKGRRTLVGAVTRGRATYFASSCGLLSALKRVNETDACLPPGEPHAVAPLRSDAATITVTSVGCVSFVGDASGRAWKIALP